MQRTTGLESDVGGRDRTLVWEPAEIDMLARNINPAAVITSELIHLEGFRHFHVYVNRSNAAIALSIRVVPIRPQVRSGAAPLAAAAGVPIGVWAAAGGTSGVFYWGESLLLTDAAGRNWRFAPLVLLEIENTGGAPVTVDAWVHAQD